MMKRSHDAAVSIFGNLGIFILESGEKKTESPTGNSHKPLIRFFVPDIVFYPAENIEDIKDC